MARGYYNNFNFLNNLSCVMSVLYNNLFLLEGAIFEQFAYIFGFNSEGSTVIMCLAFLAATLIYADSNIYGYSSIF
ncbi:hypothetical protein VCHA53O466_40036 [Vibrio chagasii]|nr:hypothetical protein VCHA53O466_40036 [Vibrio chagasii]